MKKIVMMGMLLLLAGCGDYHEGSKPDALACHDYRKMVFYDDAWLTPDEMHWSNIKIMTVCVVNEEKIAGK